MSDLVTYPLFIILFMESLLLCWLGAISTDVLDEGPPLSPCWFYDS